MLIAVTLPLLSSSDLADTAKVTAVCRAATAASRASDDVGDWLRVIQTASDAANFNISDRAMLLRLCGLYSAGVQDATQGEMDRLIKELDEDTEEMRRLLNQ